VSDGGGGAAADRDGSIRPAGSGAACELSFAAGALADASIAPTGGAVVATGTGSLSRGERLDLVVGARSDSGWLFAAGSGRPAGSRFAASPASDRVRPEAGPDVTAVSLTAVSVGELGSSSTAAGGGVPGGVTSVSILEPTDVSVTACSLDGLAAAGVRAASNAAAAVTVPAAAVFAGGAVAAATPADAGSGADGPWPLDGRAPGLEPMAPCGRGAAGSLDPVGGELVVCVDATVVGDAGDSHRFQGSMT
jgi:hypothetical protein